MDQNFNYKVIAKHYEDCFDKHLDTPAGVDWPNAEGMQVRYKVMTDLIKPLDLGQIAVAADDKDEWYGHYDGGWHTIEDVSLLDLGCGTGHFYEYLTKHVPYIKYTGIDINFKSISFCQEKYGKPSLFQQLDILETPDKLDTYDYIVMNGIFTEKRELSFIDMFQFLQRMLKIVFPKVNKGLAFNVMSKHVDWERNDLFHLPLDMITDFMCKHLSRNFVIRNDYGLYEYTVYLYK